MKKMNKKGFTLAELLVVVAIIAILIAVAIPTFTAAQTKAYAGVAEANARSAFGEWTIDYIASGTAPADNAKITYDTGGVTTICTATDVDSAGGDLTIEISVTVDGKAAAKTYTFSTASK